MKLRKLLSSTLAVLLLTATMASCQSGEDVSSNADQSQPESSEVSNEPEVIMPEYWGFNNYNRAEMVGAPEEITSHPTTVKKVSATKYSMSCETDAGELTITLEERPWGCFNLWSWKLVDKDNTTHTFAVGATDFEYVHQPTTPKGTTVWSGGNHGNEAFLSLDLYNAETEEKIELNIGDSVTVNSLHVIEKTKLLWFPDDNSDSIGDYNNKNMTYTEDDVYAEMVRKYTFTGPQIKLNVDYKYVKDVQMGRSYSCMFPLSKKYGLWCTMYNNAGEVVKNIETSRIGKADYSGPHNEGNAATRAVIYGYNDPRYQFDVRVTTFEDSCNSHTSDNDYKTSYWDMNTTDNKLYFTKFNASKKRTITSGTEFHTESIYLFKFVEDAKLPDGSLFEDNKKEEVEMKGKLVSSNLEYTLSGLLGTGYGNYKAKLTDGKYTEALSYDSNWFSFFNNPSLPAEQLNTENGIGYLIIDLGEEKDLTGVRAHICNGGEAGINAPIAASVSISSDGEAFTEVASLPIDGDERAIYWSGADITGKSGRYVKFTFQPNGLFVFLNEVEVYAAE